MSDIVERLRQGVKVTRHLDDSFDVIHYQAEAADTIEALRRELDRQMRYESEQCADLTQALAAMTADRNLWQAECEDGTLTEQLAASQQALRNVYEVWAGSEGIPEPKTCPEAYLIQLIQQMRDAAKEGLK